MKASPLNNHRSELPAAFGIINGKHSEGVLQQTYTSLKITKSYKKKKSR